MDYAYQLLFQTIFTDLLWLTRRSTEPKDVLNHSTLAYNISAEATVVSLRYHEEIIM